MGANRVNYFPNLQSLLEYCWHNYAFRERYKRLSGIHPWVVVPTIDYKWGTSTVKTEWTEIKGPSSAR